MKMKYGSFSGIGRREKMEDCAVVHAGPGGIFAVVCDGHGEHGASMAGDVLAGLAELSCRMPRISSSAEDFARIAEMRFIELHEDLSLRYGEDTGVVATMAHAGPNGVCIANVGDAEALVVPFGPHHRFTHALMRSLAITRCHQADDLQEVRRITAAVSAFEPSRSAPAGLFDQGRLCRSDQFIRVTRSIGDGFFRGVGMICTPDCAQIPRGAFGPDDIVVVATDGVWDVLKEAPGRLAEVRDAYRASGVEAATAALDRLCAAHAADNYAGVVISGMIH